jgi:phosphatidylserine/phosphatidylglycerophosphate/cardiolipin synthase-like enzyme
MANRLPAVAAFSGREVMIRHPSSAQEVWKLLKLLIQPGDGVGRLVKGIKKAKKSVEIVIFRFDRDEITRALVDAVERGVFVHALIAFTNRGGEEHLRKLEMRLLERGITVARTAGDLVRYHGKMMLVDRKELYVLAFNLTHLDIDHSRSFGIITRNSKLVKEAGKLFDADTKRQEYVPGHSNFVVSPANSRTELAAFIKGAKKELLIYDPKVSDRAMLRLLEEREGAGVEIRIIGHVAKSRFQARDLTRMRLHTRTMLRDGKHIFVGSQSLRQLELDARREIGIIFCDASVQKAIVRVFEEDWAASEPAESADARKLASLPIGKTAKKMAKIVGKNLPVDPMVKELVKAVRRRGGNGKMNSREIEHTVKGAVKQAVKDSVKEATKAVVKGMVEEAAIPKKRQ